MAVNLAAPRAQDLLPIAGVRLGVAEAGIRKKDRKDLLVVEIAAESRVGGVFTRNRYSAAPVTVCREHLAGESRIRALVVNTGIANAGTGTTGLADARATCAAVAKALGVEARAVLPFSTGVITSPRGRPRASFEAPGRPAVGLWESLVTSSRVNTGATRVSRQRMCRSRTLVLRQVGARTLLTPCRNGSRNRDLVEQGFKGLSSEDQEILILRDLEEFSAEEVAKTLGLSLAAVKSRLHRARLRFMANVRGKTHGA